MAGLKIALSLPTLAASVLSLLESMITRSHHLLGRQARPAPWGSFSYRTFRNFTKAKQFNRGMSSYVVKTRFLCSSNRITPRGYLRYSDTGSMRVGRRKCSVRCGGRLNIPTRETRQDNNRHLDSLRGLPICHLLTILMSCMESRKNEPLTSGRPISTKR